MLTSWESYEYDPEPADPFHHGRLECQFDDSLSRDTLNQVKSAPLKSIAAPHG
jgi:hypothetical protein